MKIAVVGTGYVGLVSGTCFAETGNTVTCVDIDEKKVERLKNGEITIYEPGLEKLFLRNQKENRLLFTTNLEEGVRDAQVIFLALPTPPGEDGSADMQYVLRASEQLGKILKDYRVIVDKSTVPVGTAEKVREVIQKYYKGEFDVVSNPEFLREGAAVDDFMKPARVIIGTSSSRARDIMTELYMPFVRQGNPIVFMDEKSAELTKYASNSFLAMKISFMNEIAQLCERLGADVDMVRKGMGSDDRIGKRFLFAGIGYGGSCFPKDVKALQYTAREADYEFKILDAVMKVNNEQRLHLLPALRQYFQGSLKGRKIAIWGLAFKPNTDDIREAPAMTIVTHLLEEGAVVSVFDPEAIKNVKEEMGDKLRYGKDPYDAAQDCEALLIATEWNEFRTPDFDRLAGMMKNKAIFDGRNLFELNKMRDLNFHYVSIGRQVINSKP